MGKKAKKKTGKKASKPKANGGAVVEARAVRDGSAAVASKLETGNKPAAKSPKETVDQLMNMMAEAGIDIKTRGDAALEAKKLRDELAVLVAKEEKEIADKGLGKEALKDVHLAHTLMGLATKLMAEGGIIEDEKHSSLTYCEEHRDELYRDGGAEFRRQLANAIKKAKTEAGLGAELESLLEMEQRKGLFKLLRNLASEIKAKQFDRSTLSEDQKKMIDEIGHLEKKGDREGMFRLIRKFDSMMQEGLPPEKRGGLEDMFLGTIIDDELFAPPPPSPDCPVCFLALPGRRFCTYQPCCGKVLCDGCIMAVRDSSLEYSCPFCRASLSGLSDADLVERTTKRAAINDEEACLMLGSHYLVGAMGVKQNYEEALELIGRAADLGSLAAHHTLGVCYQEGTGVEKDEKKSLHHLRLAAIGGMVESRFTLGCFAQKKKDSELALKHWVIAAEAGHDDSMKLVKRGYAQGAVTRYVFAKTLRAYKAAKDEMESNQRKRAVDWKKAHDPANAGPKV